MLILADQLAISESLIIILLKKRSHSFKESLLQTKNIKHSDNNTWITTSLTYHQMELLNLTQNYLQQYKKLSRVV